MAPVVDDVDLHARLQPGRIAARDLDRGQAWSYAALAAMIARCVTVLTARGVRAGDRVAALAHNRIELVVLHLACARLGAIYVPLNWRLSPTELRALVADAEPAVVFGDSSLASLDHDGVPIERLATELAAAAPTHGAPFDRERPSLILYTSGTSGRPKGVLLSERNLDETAINFSVLARVTADSASLCDAPMFHVIGLITNVRPGLMRGGTFLISDGFDPARTLARLGDPELGVTHYFCVPQVASRLRQDPAYSPARLQGLVGLFTGGAPHAADDIRAWLDDGVVVSDGFGMSEAGTVFCMPLDPQVVAAHAGSAGLPTSRVKARIVDAEERDCAPGEAGELLLQGRNVTAGYWRRPAETAAAFTPDGWFRTGDLARVDEDGFYWLIDRKKDMFISGGENVYPAEIEAVLAGHPEVDECAVVGVPDARWGEVGRLVIVVAPGCAPDPAHILAYVRSRLARYKTPRHVSYVPALPRNAAGKVLKRDLREMLLRGEL